MKLKLLVIAASLAGVASSFGALYTVTTGTAATSSGIAPTGLVSNTLASPIAGPTTNGYQSPGSAGVVGIGIFSSLSDAQITAAAESSTGLATIAGAFQAFGALGTFNAAGPSGQKGLFSRATSATVAGSQFSGQNIYILVGNGTTFANSTELLVLKNNTLFTDAQDAIPTPLTVTITPANSTLLFGRNMADVRTTTSDSSVTAGWGTATVVPEPSAALLGALGALGLLRRRRI